MVETIGFRRGKLPHWLVAERPYFVTMRLAGSLPGDVVQQIHREREDLLAGAGVDAQAWIALRRRQFERLDALLDASAGTCAWLAKSEIASLVFENLGWLERRGWRIYAAVVMSTHIHAVMRNTAGRNGELLTDLGYFKSYTASRVNRVLGRKGAFWAPEDFDHWCRSEEKVRGACRYVCLNPVKAGLVGSWQDWPWARCEEAYRPE
jgi:putative transposase